jgi:hypothetical protein
MHFVMFTSLESTQKKKFIDDTHIDLIQDKVPQNFEKKCGKTILEFFCKSKSPYRFPKFKLF